MTLDADFQMIKLVALKYTSLKITEEDFEIANSFNISRKDLIRNKNRQARKN